MRVTTSKLKEFANQTNIVNAPWCDFASLYLIEAAAEIERLRQQNAELVEALTNLYENCRWEKVCPTIDAAKETIAKATGGE